MSDPDGRDAPSGDRGGRRPPDEADAGPADAPESPKALPKPSRASRGLPVPKPVRSGAPRAERREPGPGESDRAAEPEGPGAKAPPARGARPVAGARGASAGSIFDGPGDAPGPGERPARGQRIGAGPKPSPECPVRPAGPRPKPRLPVDRSARATTKAVKLGRDRASSTGRLATHLLRDDERVTVREDVPVAYRFVDPAGQAIGDEAHEGRLVDISLSGAQVEGPIARGVTKEDLFAGEVLVCAEMALPFVERPLAVDAQIAWVKPAAGESSFLGFRFLDMTAQQTNAIRAFFIGLQSPARRKSRRGR